MSFQPKRSLPPPPPPRRKNTSNEESEERSSSNPLNDAKPNPRFGTRRIPRRLPSAPPTRSGHSVRKGPPLPRGGFVHSRGRSRGRAGFGSKSRIPPPPRGRSRGGPSRQRPVSFRNSSRLPEPKDSILRPRLSRIPPVFDKRGIYGDLTGRFKEEKSLTVASVSEKRGFYINQNEEIIFYTTGCEFGDPRMHVMSKSLRNLFLYNTSKNRVRRISVGFRLNGNFPCMDFRDSKGSVYLFLTREPPDSVAIIDGTSGETVNIIRRLGPRFWYYRMIQLDDSHFLNLSRDEIAICSWDCSSQSGLGIHPPIPPSQNGVQPKPKRGCELLRKIVRENNRDEFKEAANIPHKDLFAVFYVGERYRSIRIHNWKTGEICQQFSAQNISSIRSHLSFGWDIGSKRSLIIQVGYNGRMNLFKNLRESDFSDLMEAKVSSNICGMSHSFDYIFLSTDRCVHVYSISDGNKVFDFEFQDGRIFDMKFFEEKKILVISRFLSDHRKECEISLIKVGNEEGSDEDELERIHFLNNAFSSKRITVGEDDFVIKMRNRNIVVKKFLLFFVRFKGCNTGNDCYRGRGRPSLPSRPTKL